MHSEIFNPYESALQAKLLEQTVQQTQKAVKGAQKAARKAERALETAHKAEQDARVAQQKQRLVTDAIREGFRAFRRHCKNNGFAGGEFVEVPSVADSSRREKAVVWPLTDDKTYVWAVTNKHEVNIARRNMTSGELVYLTMQEFADLELTVLAEIVDHFQELGKPPSQPANADNAESIFAQRPDEQGKQAVDSFMAALGEDYSHQNNLQSEQAEALPPNDLAYVHPDPDTRIADRSAHTVRDRQAYPTAAQFAGDDSSAAP